MVVVASKGEKSKGSGKGMCAQCGHAFLRSRGFRIWVCSAIDDKGGSQFFRFAGANANYPDQAAAKLASDLEKLFPTEPRDSMPNR